MEIPNWIVRWFGGNESNTRQLGISSEFQVSSIQHCTAKERHLNNTGAVVQGFCFSIFIQLFSLGYYIYSTFIWRWYYQMQLQFTEIFFMWRRKCNWRSAFRGRREMKYILSGNPLEYTEYTSTHDTG